MYIYIIWAPHTRAYLEHCLRVFTAKKTSYFVVHLFVLFIHSHSSTVPLFPCSISFAFLNKKWTDCTFNHIFAIQLPTENYPESLNHPNHKIIDVFFCCFLVAPQLNEWMNEWNEMKWNEMKWNEWMKWMKWMNEWMNEWNEWMK